MREVSLKRFKELLLEIKKFKIFRFIGYLTIPFFFGFYILNKTKTKLSFLYSEKKRILQDLVIDIEYNFASLQKRNQEIEINDTYLIYSEKEECLSKIRNFIRKLGSIQRYFDILPNEIITFCEQLEDEAFIILEKTEQYNEQFIQRKKIEYENLFKRENLILDDEQQRAIIIDDKHNLVVAGAGSGKTEVLTTRIGYLIKRKTDRIKPERILALAFQKKAEEVIKKRLKKRYNIDDVEIRTFHSFGKRIIEDYAKKRKIDEYANKKFINPKKLNPNCEDESKYRNFIRKIFEKIRDNDVKYQNQILLFMKHFSDEKIIKVETDFEEKEEFYEYQRNMTYTTLNGTKVRSESERSIANFFIKHEINGNKINILYEEPAKWMAYMDEEGKEHTPNPDFYFPYFDIYLEHWAIDKDGNVPKWFSGENPTENYRKGMDIKRSKFKENNKFLIETTEAEFKSIPINELLKEKFLTALKKKNPQKEFKLSAIPYKGLVEKVWDECRAFVNSLPLNISRYITIAKTYGLTISDIEKRLQKKKNWSLKQIAFGKIALRIYQEYENKLDKSYSIDFGDMINNATKYLNENKDFFLDKYDHILIDEYQDISAQRFLLIEALMKKNPKCKLFCVGDDWQSIMGFAGSNLNYFIHFYRYFDHPVRTDLIKNYRSIKSIVDVGATVIENNTNQIKKQTIANKEMELPILVFSSRHNKDYPDKYYKQITSHALEKINELVKKEGYKYDDFMILLRIAKNPKLRKYLNSDNAYGIPISAEPAKSNCVHILSVHKSKGLESRVVILLNVDKGLYGFPCELENPKIFETAIKENDGLREQEERRLFYVALTRAKEQIIIYTQKQSESSFIAEIEEFIQKKELYY